MQKGVQKGRKVKKTKAVKKITALFLSLFILSITFITAFNLSVPAVKAQEELYWCMETTNGNICQPNTLADDCK